MAWIYQRIPYYNANPVVDRSSSVHHNQLICHSVFVVKQLNVVGLVDNGISLQSHPRKERILSFGHRA